MSVLLYKYDILENINVLGVNLSYVNVLIILSENKIPNRTVWVWAYLFPKLVPRVNINQSELWDLSLNRHESSLPRSTQSALPQYHPSEEKYNKDINWSLNQTVNDSKTFNQNLMVVHANVIK